MNRAAKIILINPKKEILLYLRDDKPTIPYPGYWDLFGGAIEKGESDLEAIKREVKEEIDISVTEIESLGKIFVKGDPLNIGDHEVSLFKGKVDKPLGSIQLNEGQKLDYFKAEQLSKIKFPYFYRDFIIQNRKTFGI